MGNYDKSNELFNRAMQAIPGGIPGHQSPTLLVFGSSPRFIDRAEGSRFWDVDGNEYIVYMCAYGPMILGYNHPKVEQAARELRTILSTPSSYGTSKVSCDGAKK